MPNHLKFKLTWINGVRVLQNGGQSVCIHYSSNKVCWWASIWLIFVLISFMLWVNTQQSIFNVFSEYSELCCERVIALAAQWPRFSQCGKKRKQTFPLPVSLKVQCWKSLCRHRYIEQVGYGLKLVVTYDIVMPVFVVELHC